MPRNLASMKALITRSNTVYRPTYTSAAAASAITTPTGLTGSTGNSVDSARDATELSAAPYNRPITRTNSMNAAGSQRAADFRLAITVCPVARYRRPTASVSAYLRTTPMTMAHISAIPYPAAPASDVTMSPAPTLAAASTSPGPRSAHRPRRAPAGGAAPARWSRRPGNVGDCRESRSRRPSPSIGESREPWVHARRTGAVGPRGTGGRAPARRGDRAGPCDSTSRQAGPRRRKGTRTPAKLTESAIGWGRWTHRRPAP